MFDTGCTGCGCTTVWTCLWFIITTTRAIIALVALSARYVWRALLPIDHIPRIAIRSILTCRICSSTIILPFWVCRQRTIRDRATTQNIALCNCRCAGIGRTTIWAWLRFSTSFIWITPRPWRTFTAIINATRFGRRIWSARNVILFTCNIVRTCRISSTGCTIVLRTGRLNIGRIFNRRSFFARCKAIRDVR